MSGQDRTTRIIETVYLIIILTAFVLVAIAAADAKATNWVSTLQARFNAFPGQVLPADPRFPDMPRFKYIGTNVEGKDYYVHLKQLGD